MPSHRTTTERITWSKVTGKAVTHGLVGSYTRDGCRCDDCWDAYRNSPGHQRELALQRQTTANAKGS